MAGFKCIGDSNYPIMVYSSDRYQISISYKANDSLMMAHAPYIVEIYLTAYRNGTWITRYYYWDNAKRKTKIKLKLVAEYLTKALDL